MFFLEHILLFLTLRHVSSPYCLPAELACACLDAGSRSPLDLDDLTLHSKLCRSIHTAFSQVVHSTRLLQHRYPPE